MLGGQGGTVREMDVDMPVGCQDANLPEGGGGVAWSKEEDDKLWQLVKQHGPHPWNLIASFLPGRSGTMCVERWSIHGDPLVKRGRWSPEEESKLIHANRVCGTKWVKIAALLPGRPPKMVQNHWNGAMQNRHAPPLFLCLNSAHALTPLQFLCQAPGTPYSIPLSYFCACSRPSSIPLSYFCASRGTYFMHSFEIICRPV